MPVNIWPTIWHVSSEPFNKINAFIVEWIIMCCVTWWTGDFLGKSNSKCIVVLFFLGGGGLEFFYSSKNTQYSLIYLSRGTCDVFAQGNRADVASPGEEPGKRGHQHILLFMYRLSFIGSLRTDCIVATNTQPVWESACEVIKGLCVRVFRENTFCNATCVWKISLGEILVNILCVYSS